MEVRRGSFLVATRDGRGGLVELEAKPSGHLSGDCAISADWPATGDWVALRPRPGLSSNETVFIVTAAGNDFSVRRTERYGSWLKLLAEARLLEGDEDQPAGAQS